MRDAKQAGTLYPKREAALRSAISDCFEKGPGSQPLKAAEPVPAILPHGRLEEFGPVAAWAYHHYGFDPPVDTVLLLSQGVSTATSMETWQTPLGPLRADQGLVRALDRTRFPLDDEAMGRASAIEVHLPFLRYLDRSERLKIVPILVGDDDIRELALTLKEVLIEHSRRLLIIAISTLTVHGPRYNHLRFTMDPPAQIRDHDREIVDHLRDAATFDTYLNQTGCHLSAPRAIQLFLRLVTGTPVLEQYEQVGERDIVSNACILFPEKV